MEYQTLRTSVTGEDIAAADNYYPSADGLDVQGVDKILLDMVCSGGVTVTIEAHASDEPTPTFIDITESVKSLNTGVDSAASFVDKSDLLQILNCQFTKIRAKYVTADTSNDVYLRFVTQGNKTSKDE